MTIYPEVNLKVNFQMFKLDIEKPEEAEIKLPTSVGSLKKQESSRKTSTSLLNIPKPLTVWITTNCGKVFKILGYQTTLPASFKTCMQFKKKQLELDMEQQAGSKLGKEYVKAVYCHPAYLTYMQSTSCEMPGWMKHKLESRLPGEMLITSNMQMDFEIQSFTVWNLKAFSFSFKNPLIPGYFFL